MLVTVPHSDVTSDMHPGDTAAIINTVVNTIRTASPTVCCAMSPITSASTLQESPNVP